MGIFVIPVVFLKRKAYIQGRKIHQYTKWSDEVKFKTWTDEWGWNA